MNVFSSCVKHLSGRYKLDPTMGYAVFECNLQGIRALFQVSSILPWKIQRNRKRDVQQCGTFEFLQFLYFSLFSSAQCLHNSDHIKQRNQYTNLSINNKHLQR